MNCWSLIRRWATVLILASTVPCLAWAVEMDPSTQAHLEVTTAPLVSRSAPASVAAAMEVLDPAPLARLIEDIAAAEAAANASSAESHRTRSLLAADGNVSRKATETAEAQAVADQARVRQLRTQLRTEWGAAFASLSVEALRQRMQSVLDGYAVLVRAQLLDVPPNAWQPHGASVLLANGGACEARVLGSLPRATAGFAADWLLEVSDETLVPGMHLTGHLDDDRHAMSGVIVPRSALVRWNGLTWAYVAVDSTHFERRVVTPLQRLTDGWLIGAPFKAGEHVVTQGANALMAIDAYGTGTAINKSDAADGDD